MQNLFSLAAASLMALSLPAAAEPLRIFALGDMPYGEPAEVNPLFEALIAELNRREGDLAIHIGDTKSGGTPCSDEMLAQQHSYLDSFAAPLLYTPGDNEWTDCHRKAAGGFDPLERLDHIRGTYFAEPGMSFGQAPVAVQNQAAEGYPENARLVLNGIVVVTAHVVGSNNNLEARDVKAAEEFFARDAANIAWLNAAFDAAADAPALILAIQADMFEFDFNEFGDETWLRHSGFKAFGEALKTRAAAFGRPVLLVYGDSHIFRVTRPFPQTAPNITALEVFGEADMHAVEIIADPDTPEVFGFRPVYNPALTAPKG